MTDSEAKQERITGIWGTGKPAPYDLYRANGTLVEAGGVLLVNRGDPVTASISERVSKQIYPAALPPVTTHILVRDADGNPTLDADGNAVTEEVTIEPEADIKWLTDYAPILAPEDDLHCDMCGNLRDDASLKKIGIGWYCDVEREAPNDPRRVSCFNRRLEQMS